MDIKKSTLYFVGKFWLYIVQHRLYPTIADNTLTLDRAILVSRILVGYYINFAQWMQDDIHERDFLKITSILFPCLIQRLCDVARVPVLPEIDHCIKLTQVAVIGFIRDDANLVTQKKTQHSTSYRALLFKRPLDSSEQVERPALGGDFEAGRQLVEILATTGSEGDI